MTNINEALTLLNIHYKSFADVKEYAEKYGHPHPCDTRAWSQILVSALTGITIDTPRFNGCIKSGTKSGLSGTMASLDEMPHLFFVLWDVEPGTQKERCRVWLVLPHIDPVFRAMCNQWYEKRTSGEIRSDNFQLHPPRNKNSNVFRNTCGNLTYPLLFAAVREPNGFTATTYDPTAMTSARCQPSGE